MAPKSLEGQTLGKYHILEPLGQGGMAQVYRAYHPSLDRYVAIKILRSDLVEDQEFLSRFSREARSVAALRHPNIVQVFDFDVEDEVYYMVMELLEGDTLKAYLNRYRGRSERVPPAEICRILTDVLKGLGYAHGEGIIHRDIKPANILLTRKGEAVITDFGIAQIVGGTKYTVAGALMGTLHYMAPEQGIGKNIDARSDIYSLGVVLYEMLIGHPPFDADTPLAILMKHMNDPLPIPTESGRTIPEPFERVVLKALAKQPEDRYQTAEAMLQAVQEAAAAYGSGAAAYGSGGAAYSGGGAEGLSVDGSAGEIVTDPAVDSETPLVFSGTERRNITDRQFAVDDTDANLEQKLRTQDRAGTAPGAAAPGAPEGSLDDVLKAAGNLFTSVGGVVTVALNSAAENVRQGVTGPVKGLAEQVEGIQAEPATRLAQPSVGRSALIGVGIMVGVNLVALALGTSIGWWGLFEYGWAFEMLLVALLLSLVMGATENIWILTPVGIIAGNAFILAFCSLTGNWGAWGILWPLEPLLLFVSIYLPMRLSRHDPDGGKRLARNLGMPLAILSGLMVVLIGLGSIIMSIIRSVFPIGPS